MSHPGLTLWFTGFSGAGKSTLGRIVASELRRDGHRVEMLDGERAREQLSKGLGFSKKDRDDHVRRLAFVADLLSRNGVIVVVAAISPYREAREQARTLMDGRFVEIHVKASIHECARRDVKGLYEKAFRGEIENFTGVSDPYEEPRSPELALDTESDLPQKSAAKVLAYLEQRG